MSRLIPPVVARVQVPGWPTLWLPLLVLWPLLLVLFFLLLCVAVPLAVLHAAPPRAVLSAVFESFHILCALHGTEIRVSTPGQDTDSSWALSLY